MALMILGLALFLGPHMLKVVPGVRAGFVGAIGEGPYKIAYSVASLAGLVVTAEGYKAWQASGSPILYEPPIWLAHVSLLLMLLAFILLVETYTNGYLKRAVKHPMILAVKVWAFAHLIANGDAVSVTLFSAFLVWAVIDRISVARRERAGEISPRNFTPTLRGDAIAVGIGGIFYALFVWKLHLWLIGVSPIVTMPAI